MLIWRDLSLNWNTLGVRKTQKLYPASFTEKFNSEDGEKGTPKGHTSTYNSEDFGRFLLFDRGPFRYLLLIGLVGSIS